MLHEGGAAILVLGDAFDLHDCPQVCIEEVGVWRVEEEGRLEGKLFERDQTEV